MPTPLKVIFGTILVVSFLILGYVLMIQKQTASQSSVVNTTETVSQESSSDTMTLPPSSEPAPASSVDKLQELQNQVTAGTITPEEAMKQMDTYNNTKTGAEGK
ncbi:MAG: hypothetical protein PHH40_01805 [Candidatus Moranbacteria bacterium]|nr:hypothetical protein [Candidatus Moranbacteria bacterium]MDD3965045.1 hypothetical protein [Candidatus Moranbacteria bacterium]